MSTTQSPAPTIRNAGTKPQTPHKLFVNIPVNDVQRTIRFFEDLGFTFNTQFTDAGATCMLVGEDAYFMLLGKERFGDFSKRPAGDPSQETNALFAITVESREDVGAMVELALASGGTPAGPAQDLGFMYQSSFYDLDGYHWEVFWMDPSAIAN